MSQPKKVIKTTTVPKPKVAKAVKIQEPVIEQVEKPKRQRRAKEKLTKQEMLQFFEDSLSELKQIVVDLKDEEMKISGLQLKQLPLLINETLQNLDEDMKEIEEEMKIIESMPDSECLVRFATL